MALGHLGKKGGFGLGVGLRTRAFHNWMLQNRRGIADMMRGVLLEQANAMVADMKGTTDDVTGKLDQSMKVEDGENRLTVVISAGGDLTTKDNYDYALAIEYGTRKTPAEPFFWPAWRKRRRLALRAFEKAIEEHFRGRTRGGSVID